MNQRVHPNMFIDLAVTYFLNIWARNLLNYLLFHALFYQYFKGSTACLQHPYNAFLLRTIQYIIFVTNLRPTLRNYIPTCSSSSHPWCPQGSARSWAPPWSAQNTGRRGSGSSQCTGSPWWNGKCMGFWRGQTLFTIR